MNPDRLRALLLALASGLSLGLAGPPLELWPLAFLWPPLLWGALGARDLPSALEAEPSPPLAPLRHPLRRALLLGLLAGALCNLIYLTWVVGLLQDFARFPLIAAIPTTLVLAIAQAFPFVLATFLYATLGQLGYRSPWILPAAISLGFSLAPALFPWRASSPLMLWLPWVQLAELGGSPLLDLLAAMAGMGLVLAATRRDRGPRLRALAIGLGCLLLPALYGHLRLPSIEAARRDAPSLRVGVVQPNVGIFDKHDPALFHAHLERLRELSLELEAQGAELILWPESAYPFPLHRRLRHDPPGARSIRRDGPRGPILFGAVTQEGTCRRYNSIVGMDAEGRFVGISDKVRLMPFGEFVPLWHWLPPLQQMFRCPGIVPGEAPRAIDVAGVRAGVLNCYEDVLPAFAAQVALEDPELLVNLTNDAWFGDSVEPHLHQLVSRGRSIETRRDLLRAVNTGVSAHISATGAELHRTQTFEQTSFLVRIPRLRGMTPWVRFGDLVTPALGGVLIGLFLAGLRLRRRRRR
ncbi:MAG: apolipoprotein N-acyltransferase [Myxococcales bacterium]|nr:apolipoprotein N-acyltransferase [Myxococcales bacterium]